MDVKQNSQQISGFSALDQESLGKISQSHFMQTLPATTRQALAEEITCSVRTLLTSIHPSLERHLSPLTRLKTPESLFDACEVNLYLFRNFRDLLPASCLTAEINQRLNKTEEALTTIKYFTERISRPDAYERESSGMTVSFIASTLTQLHTSFSTAEFSNLLELAAHIPAPTLPVIEQESMPAEQQFVPPETTITTRELPREPSAFAKLARQAERIADEKVLSPLESFLARHEKIAVIASTTIALGAGGAALYLNPQLTLIIAVTAAIGVITATTIPSITNLLRRFAGRGRSHRKSEKEGHQRELNAIDSKPVDLSLPEKRTVNLGSKASNPFRHNTQNASQLSDTAAQNAKAFQSSQLEAHTELFRSRMGVTAIYVTAGSAGEVQRFDSFCQEHDKANPGQSSMLEEWYPERLVPARISKSDDGIEGRISFTTRPGRQSFPLPAGFSVTAIEFFDAEGERFSLSEGIHIREALLGGFFVEIPDGVERIKYAVVAGDKHIAQEK